MLVPFRCASLWRMTSDKKKEANWKYLPSAIRVQSLTRSHCVQYEVNCRRRCECIVCVYRSINGHLSLRKTKTRKRAKKRIYVPKNDKIEPVLYLSLSFSFSHLRLRAASRPALVSNRRRIFLSFFHTPNNHRLIAWHLNTLMLLVRFCRAFSTGEFRIFPFYDFTPIPNA